MRLADLRFETVDGILVAHIDGEIDASNAADLGIAIARELSNDTLGLVLDLAEVEYLDSAGIHLIYRLRARLASRGQDVRLVVVPTSPIADALRFAGVMGTVGAAETPEAALEGLRSLR
jgi:anti-anti-sigma factor